MSRGIRSNPLPPPVVIGPRMRNAGSIIRTALEKMHADPRRVLWAVGRVVEEIYRHAEARGELADDRLEDGLAAVQRFCLDPDALKYPEPKVDYYWGLLTTWRELPHPRAWGHEDPGAARMARRLSSIELAIWRFVYAASNFASNSLHVRETCSGLETACKKVAWAWSSYGEPEKAVEARIANTLRGALAEAGPQ